jgi:hypothetical protein
MAIQVIGFLARRTGQMPVIRLDEQKRRMGSVDWDSLFTFDSSVEAIAEAARKVVLNPVRHQLDDIFGAVQNSFAVCAGLEVSLHPRAQLRDNVVVDVIRDFPPNFQATYLNHAH